MTGRGTVSIQLDIEAIITVAAYKSVSNEITVTLCPTGDPAIFVNGEDRSEMLLGIELVARKGNTEGCMTLHFEGDEGLIQQVYNLIKVED
jgi:hypothetical protein